MVYLISIAFLVFSFQGEIPSSAANPCEELDKEERFNRAGIHIQNIKSSGVVVVLESNRRKMEVLEREVDIVDEEKNSKKSRSKKKLENLQEKTNERAQSMMMGFEDHYDFSEVFFIWDFDIPHLRSRPDSSLLLNRDLEYFPTTDFSGDGDLYFIMRGRVDQGTGSGLEAYIVKDRNLNYLCRPFPYYVGRNDNWFINALFSIFDPNLYGEREAAKIAQMFQKKFEDFSEDI